MRTLLAIGIGMGDPEHLTVQAVRALGRVDAVLVFDKGEQLAAQSRARRNICERYVAPRPYRWIEIADAPRDANIADYAARVDAWHERRSIACEERLAAELGEEEIGAILIWGDPSLYDSTLRLLERLRARGRVPFEYEVIPGISSLQALAATHKLTLNRIGGAVHVTTGRRLARALPREADDVVVMLDGECAWSQVPGEEYDIYWSAYLGSEHELSVAGRLADKKDEIERVRAAARSRHGWIMDTYLLRRRVPGELERERKRDNRCVAPEDPEPACPPEPKVG
jgi:precorrin-6A synthase